MKKSFILCGIILQGIGVALGAFNQTLYGSPTLGLIFSFILLDGLFVGFCYIMKKQAQHIHALKRQQRHRLKHQQETERQAFYDSLTKLPNRIYFERKLQMAITEAQKNHQKFVLLFVDLDGFKEVNDCFGHQIGDSLLKEVAMQLQQGLRKQDFIARLGGDEFTILLPGIKQRKDVEQLAEKVIHLIHNVGFDYSLTCSVTASIGIALFPYHGITAGTLLHQADQSMYMAKGLGKNTYFFPEQDELII